MNITTMNLEQVISRMKEIETTLKEASGDTLNALETETEQLIARKAELEKEVADAIKRKALNEKLGVIKVIGKL